MLVAVITIKKSGEPDLWDHKICDEHSVRHVRDRILKEAGEAGLRLVKVIVTPVRKDKWVSVSLMPDNTEIAEYGL